jgi:hypothetical protein
MPLTAVGAVRDNGRDHSRRGEEAQHGQALRLPGHGQRDAPRGPSFRYDAGSAAAGIGTVNIVGSRRTRAEEELLWTPLASPP